MYIPDAALQIVNISLLMDVFSVLFKRININLRLDKR